MKPNPFSSLNHFTVPVAIAGPPRWCSGATRRMLQATTADTRALLCRSRSPACTSQRLAPPGRLVGTTSAWPPALDNGARLCPPAGRQLDRGPSLVVGPTSGNAPLLGAAVTSTVVGSVTPPRHTHSSWDVRKKRWPLTG